MLGCLCKKTKPVQKKYEESPNKQIQQGCPLQKQKIIIDRCGEIFQMKLLTNETLDQYRKIFEMKDFMSFYHKDIPIRKQDEKDFILKEILLNNEDVIIKVPQSKSAQLTEKIRPDLVDSYKLLQIQTDLYFARDLQGVRAQKNIFAGKNVLNFDILVSAKQHQEYKYFEAQTSSQVKLAIVGHLKLDVNFYSLIKIISAVDSQQNIKLSSQSKYYYEEHLLIKQEMNLDSFRLPTPEFLSFFDGKEINDQTLQQFYLQFGVLVPIQVKIGGKLFILRTSSSSSQSIDQTIKINTDISTEFLKGVTITAKFDQDLNYQQEQNVETIQRVIFGGNLFEGNDEKSWLSSLQTQKNLQIIFVDSYKYSHEYLPEDVSCEINEYLKKLDQQQKLRQQQEDQYKCPNKNVIIKEQSTIKNHINFLFGTPNGFISLVQQSRLVQYQQNKIVAQQDVLTTMHRNMGDYIQSGDVIGNYLIIVVANANINIKLLSVIEIYDIQLQKSIKAARVPFGQFSNVIAVNNQFAFVLSGGKLVLVDVDLKTIEYYDSRLQQIDNFRISKDSKELICSDTKCLYYLNINNNLVNRQQNEIRQYEIQNINFEILENGSILTYNKSSLGQQFNLLHRLDQSKCTSFEIPENQEFQNILHFEGLYRYDHTLKSLILFRDESSINIYDSYNNKIYTVLTNILLKNVDNQLGLCDFFHIFNPLLYSKADYSYCSNFKHKQVVIRKEDLDLYITIHYWKDDQTYIQRYRFDPKFLDYLRETQKGYQ